MKTNEVAETAPSPGSLLAIGRVTFAVGAFPSATVKAAARPDSLVTIPCAGMTTNSGIAGGLDGCVESVRADGPNKMRVTRFPGLFSTRASGAGPLPLEYLASEMGPPVVVRPPRSMTSSDSSSNVSGPPVASS